MKEIKNTAEFNDLIKQDKPVLLDFYAEWCGPCQTLLPIISDLAEEHKEEFEIVKINVDHNPKIAQQFNVKSIPALFFLKNGNIVDKAMGLQQKSVLKTKLAELKAA